MDTLLIKIFATALTLSQATTAPDALKISFERLLPAMSRTGVFTKEGLEKVQRVYISVGEKVDVDLNEGVLWTNEFVKN